MMHTEDMEIQLYDTPNFDVACSKALKKATDMVKDMALDGDTSVFILKTVTFINLNISR